MGDRALWLLPVLSPEGLPEAWPGPWTAAAVDHPALAGPVAGMCGLTEALVVAEPADVPRPASGWTLVAGRPAFAERVLREVMSIPAGTARFPMEVGARSVIQLLDDRAVLLRLNEGRALDGA